jgi:hypothetical protein
VRIGACHRARRLSFLVRSESFGSIGVCPPSAAGRVSTPVTAMSSSKILKLLQAAGALPEGSSNLGDDNFLSDAQ